MLLVSGISNIYRRLTVPTHFSTPAMFTRSGVTPPIEMSDDSQAIKDVTWDGPNDPGNPKNMANSRKWLIVAVLASGSTSITCASSIYTTTYTQMNEEFIISKMMGTWGLSLFVFGLGISPMILGPLSEFYGRRPIYVIFYTLYTIWLIPCAVARNIETMLVSRFLEGIFGSAFLSITGGTIGDVFAAEQLQAPMTIYSASMFLGPGMRHLFLLRRDSGANSS